MSYINKDNTVYDNVDFSEPGLKELIDYVCSHFYGAAYAKVVDKKLIGFTIDGELYNLEDPDFTKKMGIKLYQIEKAVNDFDESFKGELPEHFSKEHLINHPRWIYARRQYGYVKEKEDEYLCPITGEEKTISFWLNLIGSSNGNFLSYPDDINLKQKVTYDEFALMFERIPFEQEKNYTEFIVKVFVGTYENLYGNKTDFSLLTEMLNEFLAYETPEEAFFNQKNRIYACLMAISSQILIESQKVADPYFYHPDLVIFMDMADYINGIGASKAVLGDDKFPVILYKNKTYDFRNVQQRKFYENLIMKSPKGTKMSKKKTKRK